MRVEDLMTTDVITVWPETSLKDVAGSLLEHGIGGVPVCDASGAVVGVVSESDILWKELRELPERSGLVRRLLDTAYGDDERTRARTAGDAMSSPAITVQPDVPIARAARLMVECGINRLPVLSHGRLVGIIARSDLVRAYRRSDDEIAREISEDVFATLCVDPGTLSIAVHYGDVVISGEVENHSTAITIERHVRGVPGVASVRSELSWEIDDRARRTAHAADTLPRKV
jgi:CBS domain-containing protein